MLKRLLLLLCGTLAWGCAVLPQGPSDYVAPAPVVRGDSTTLCRTIDGQVFRSYTVCYAHQQVLLRRLYRRRHRHRW